MEGNTVIEKTENDIKSAFGGSLRALVEEAIGQACNLAGLLQESANVSDITASFLAADQGVACLEFAGAVGSAEEWTCKLAPLGISAGEFCAAWREAPANDRFGVELLGGALGDPRLEASLASLAAMRSCAYTAINNNNCPKD
jgi:hypothetical protein